MNVRTHNKWFYVSRMVAYSIVFLFLSSFVLTSVHAYTSPGSPTGFVNDFAGMMTEEARTALESELRTYQSKTGNEIVVATVPSLGGDDIESYAVRLFEEWKPGKEGKDNGILLLVVRDERQMRIEVGYGLEGALNDAKAGAIIRNVMTPRFRDGDYSAGITEGARQIIAALAGEPIPEAPQRESRWSSNFLSFVLEVGVFVLIGLFGTLAHFLGKTKSWWLGGVIGGVIGLVIAFWVASLILSGILIVILTLLGLLADYSFSKGYASHHAGGHRPWWWGGGSYGGGGGGFGGFGGGSSGGGGASGSW